jgi:hypothetical protein
MVVRVFLKFYYLEEPAKPIVTLKKATFVLNYIIFLEVSISAANLCIILPYTILVSGGFVPIWAWFGGVVNEGIEKLNFMV